MSIPKPVVLITSILPFCSPCLAASDEELAKLGDKMSGAFKCSIYASLFDDLKEQQRLFKIGLKAARDFVEGMKNSTIPSRMSDLQTYYPGASTDFVVGDMYADEAKKAYDDIPTDYRYHSSKDNLQAKTQYRNSNCL